MYGVSSPSSFPYNDQWYLKGHPQVDETKPIEPIIIPGLVCSPNPDDVDHSHLDNHPMGPIHKS